MGYETRERIRVLKDLGRSERAAGELEAARSLYEEAVLLCRAEGHAVLLAHTLRHLADIHREAGRLDRAEVCCDEALAIYRQEVRRRPLDVAKAFRTAALLMEARGQPDGARPLWEEARVLFDEVGAQEGIDECCAHLESVA
jgi:tetratricopeptide (TPR) repeat protein